jgi:hypothetical protein
VRESRRIPVRNACASRTDHVRSLVVLLRARCFLTLLPIDSSRNLILRVETYIIGVHLTVYIECHGQNVIASDVCLRHTDQLSR